MDKRLAVDEFDDWENKKIYRVTYGRAGEEFFENEDAAKDYIEMFESGILELKMTLSKYNPMESHRLLTAAEKAEIDKMNADSHYGISYETLEELILEHHSARLHSQYREMARIEYRLTDINYHIVCQLLATGKYDEALQRVKEEHEADE
jgi:hypothetical protein